MTKSALACALLFFMGWAAGSAQSQTPLKVKPQKSEPLKVQPEKTCIAFISDSDNQTNEEPAKEPLRTAVTLSGDFEFYPTVHEGCWSIHVLSLPLLDTNGWQSGYVVSYATTAPSGFFLGHGLQTGPRDGRVFEDTMREAAARTIELIRISQRSIQ